MSVATINAGSGGERPRPMNSLQNYPLTQVPLFHCPLQIEVSPLKEFPP